MAVLHASLPFRPWADPRLARLPGIQPLDPADWLRVDEVHAAQMAERDRLIATRPEDVHALLPQAEEAARAAGYRIGRIEAPGTLDGGDVLKYGGKVWVGRGGRTNQEGIDQLASLLSELGAEVITVPLTKVLHLKTAVTALPDGTVVGYEPLVDDPDMFENFMAVPEEAGAHVVLLGGNKVLMSTSAPKTKELFEARGLDVVAVDISEYEKLEGCVTCLSVRMRGHVD